MAQSTIIEVTVDYIGSTAMGGVSRGLDIQNFAGPVKTGPLGTYIRYVEGGAYNIKQNEPSAVTTYIVQESLADIALIAEGAVVLTVERFGKSYEIGTVLGTAEPMLFDVNKFANDAKPNSHGTGCEFYYRETGAADPIYYQVSETLPAIIAAVPVGPAGQITGTLTPTYIPYATAANTLGDSNLIHDATFTRVSAGTAIAAAQAGESEISFGLAGDQFNVYTDGGGGAESYIEMTTTSAEIAAFGGASGISMQLSNVTINNATAINLAAPLVTIVDTGVIDAASPAATVTLFNTNAVIVNSGGNGGTWNMASTFAMQAAELQMAAGTVNFPSFSIQAGVAPAAPANGDAWSTANNDELVMRQNGVSATLLSAKAVTAEALVSDTSVTVVIGGVTYKLLARA